MPPAPHPYLKKLGARIRVLRVERGFSQEAFADKCHIDRSYMSGIERGVRNISVLRLVSIARALGIRLPQLLSFD